MILRKPEIRDIVGWVNRRSAKKGCSTMWVIVIRERPRKLEVN
jgi:hypothetical protein